MPARRKEGHKIQLSFFKMYGIAGLNPPGSCRKALIKDQCQIMIKDQLTMNHRLFI